MKDAKYMCEDGIQKLFKENIKHCNYVIAYRPAVDSYMKQYK